MRKAIFACVAYIYSSQRETRAHSLLPLLLIVVDSSPLDLLCSVRKTNRIQAPQAITHEGCSQNHFTFVSGTQKVYSHGYLLHEL